MTETLEELVEISEDTYMLNLLEHGDEGMMRTIELIKGFHYRIRYYLDKKTGAMYPLIERKEKIGYNPRGGEP